MELKDAFNSQYDARLTNSYVLDLYYSSRAGSVYMAVDFLTRTMITRTGSSDGGLVVTPFSQLDREVLVALHDKLVELGGKPPALAPEAPTAPGNSRPLRP